jgi:hypothetical protein
MAEDVTGGIDADAKSGVFHQPDYVFACGQVRFGIAEAGDAAVGIASVLAELDQCGLQTLRIDVLLGRGALRAYGGCKRCGK